MHVVPYASDEYPAESLYKCLLLLEIGSQLSNQFLLYTYISIYASRSRGDEYDARPNPPKPWSLLLANVTGINHSSVPTPFQLWLAMAAIMSLFVPLSIVLASYTAESRRGQHPLCRTLDNRERQQSDLYPLECTCHGDDDDAICKFLDTDNPEARASKVSVDEVNRYQYKEYCYTHIW